MTGTANPRVDRTRFSNRRYVKYASTTDAATRANLPGQNRASIQIARPKISRGQCHRSRVTNQANPHDWGRREHRASNPGARTARITSAAPTVGTAALQPGNVTAQSNRTHDATIRPMPSVRSLGLRAAKGPVHEHERRTDEQFPQPCKRKEVGIGRCSDHQHQIQQEGSPSIVHTDERPGSPANERRKQQRPGDVELFLDAKRPQVQQRIAAPSATK